MASNRKEVTPGDVLVAILVEAESFAAKQLSELGLMVEVAEDAALNRYLATVAEQERKFEELRRKIAEESAVAGDQPNAVLAVRCAGTVESRARHRLRWATSSDFRLRRKIGRDI